MERTVSPEAEAIYTDEFRSNVGLETDTRRHETVQHNADEWVIGDVHANSVEGVWSRFKRSDRRELPQDEREAEAVPRSVRRRSVVDLTGR